MSLAENSAMRQAIPLVNEIQEYFAKSKQAIAFDLPQIVVVGSQSVGKSSVLENFVGREFLPRGSGIVTRRPLVLQLVKITDQEEYGVFAHREDKRFTDFLEIRHEIEEETTREAGRGKFISDVPISLKIYSPNVVDLTLVDLPGLTRVPVGDQPADIEKIVTNMILSFIEKENCLILAVSPANADLATSDAIKLAQKVDPAGDRTIGVLSKLDLMDPGTDAREILENKKEPGSVYLKRGYIGVVNRSQKDIQGGKTLAEALAAERDFFLDHSAYQHIADIHGTDYLRNYLNKELTKHIKERMPSVVERIKTTAALLEKELKMYHEKPDDVRGFTRLAAHMMNLVVDEFQKRMGDVSSRLDSVDLNERCLGSIIRNVFQKNFEQHIESSLSIEDIELRHTILMARENTNGLRAGFFTSAKVFETIVEDQIGRLAQPALEAVDEVVVELDGAIRNMLRSMSQFPALERFACGKSIQKLGENKGKAHDYINTLLRVEKAYVETKHRTSQDHSETKDDILWKNKDGKGSAIYDGCPYQKIQLDKKQLLLYNNSKDLKDTDHHVALDLDKCFMRVHHAMNKKVQLKSDLETVTFHLTNKDTADLISKLCSIGFYPEVSETGKRVRDDVEDLYQADKKVVRQVEQVYDMIRDYMDVVIRSIWSYVPKIVIALVIDEQVKYFKVDLLSDIVNEGIKLLEEAPTLAKDRRMKQRKLDTCSKVLEVCKQLEHLSV